MLYQAHRTHFTADTHFFHKLMLRYRLGLTDVDAMHEKMIHNWNAGIKRDDYVFHLGDVTFGNPTKTREILDRLNGQIFLIKGNHDHLKDSVLGRFEWVKDIYEAKVEDLDAPEGYQRIVMCHFPMYSWHRMGYGAWMLHGHCHGNLKGAVGKIMDVGVDNTISLSPFSYADVKRNMGMVDIATVDHHDNKLKAA